MKTEQTEAIAAIKQRMAEIDSEVDRLTAEYGLLEETLERAESQG